MRRSLLIVVLLLLAAPALAQETTTPTAQPEEPPGVRAKREVARLRSRDASEREAAARALVEIGAPALPAILAELGGASELTGRLRALAIEIDPTARPGPLAADEKWYETKLREGALRVKRGDYLAAWKLLDALLIVEPDCPIRDRIQALKLRAREMYVRASVLAGKIVPKKVLVGPGEKIDFAIEAKNVSDQPLQLSFDPRGGELFGAVEIEVFRATRHGESGRAREKRNVQATVTAQLKPGESWKTLVSLPALEKTSREVFRRVTISGALRPAILRRGDEPFNAPIPLFPIDVVVVDPEFHALAAEPVEAVRKALSDVRAATDGRTRDSAAERVFFAAMIGASMARDRTVEALAECVERDGDSAIDAALPALSALADARLDRDSALEWLRRRRGL